jgi:Protein of unknown function (DUF3307)
MMIESIWLTKLILAHLISDFLLQPKSWVEERNVKHFASPKLYLHVAVTSLLAFAITGFEHWVVALVILVTHLIIDGWKSYQKPTLFYFVLDQLLHIAVIFVCWYATFLSFEKIQMTWQLLNKDLSIWKTTAAFVFVTIPAGILIGQITKQWQDKIENADSLANAGKWIGVIERIIVLIFVLKNDYAAISLLLAAKGIIRFNEKDRPEIKTEYLVIGTLLSIGIAIVVGLLVKL